MVKGAAQDSPYALGCKANLRAMVTPQTGGNIWCGTPYPKDIPVHFSQVMFALGNRNGPQ